MPLQTTSDDLSGDELSKLARFGDAVMLLTLFCSSAATLAIGQFYGDMTLALVAGALLLGLGLLAYFFGRGGTIAWMTLTLCNVAAVVLHIQLGRGTIEFHFGVFVLLGMLLVYRDWRPIVFAAALFAIHHIVFDRLQAMNIGVYCTPEPNFLKILMHALYVVMQTGIEIVFALQLRRAAVESAELTALVRHVDQGDLICLNVADMAVRGTTPQMLKQTLARMAAAVAEVNRATGLIDAASTYIADSNLDLCQRAEVQAVNLQQTLNSVESLRGTVSDTASTALQANDLARAASTTAVDGGTTVATVVKAMAEIGQASSRIADINAVIDGIAFQTNILALNAAVEAARAGEHGRGFAVVAAEVRTLALRSASAAREIKSLINDSVDKVKLGVQQVGSAGVSMEDIVNQTQRVSQLIGSISSAAAAQSQGIHAVGEAVSQLSTVTRRDASLVKDGVAAALSLRQQSALLNTVVQRFSMVAAGGKVPVAVTAAAPLATAAAASDPRPSASNLAPGATRVPVELF